MDGAGSLAEAEIPEAPSGSTWEGRLCKGLETQAGPALSGPGRWRPEGGGLMLLCWACTCENSQEGSGWCVCGAGRGVGVGQEGRGEADSRHSLLPSYAAH